MPSLSLPHHQLLRCFLIISCVVFQLAFSNSVQATPPNVILIVADDLGYAELGCYGQKWIKTPHIDKIAQHGIRFTDFYSGNAVCAPSRCCLMTGRHPGHAETRNNGDPKFDAQLEEQMGWEFPGQNPLSPAEVTVAEMLKQKDYATAAIGKWGLGHFGTTGDPNKQGFDLFYGFNSQRHAHNHYPNFLWRNDEKEILVGNDRTLDGAIHSQDRFREVALEFIDDSHERPFFLYLPFAIPHLSIQTTEKWLEKYKDVIPEEDYKHRGYLEHPFPRAGYAGMISQMDSDIGEILARVEKYGLSDNTIVMFTSDNGPTYDRLGGSDSDFFRSAGVFRGLKGSLYEGGIRVPLVASWPEKIPAGVTTNHTAAFWDIMPTIADLTETTAPEGIDGLSFAAELQGKTEAQPKHEFLYWEFPAYGGQQALRMGNWKGIYQNLAKPNVDSPFELYNLLGDPGEQQNLAAEYPEMVKQMQSIMKREHVPSPVFKFKALDDLAGE